MSKIIYIAGLGHSGSTLLDMSLGTLPNIRGLGELKTLLDEHTRMKHYTSRCSCGQLATDCEVWKEIPYLLENNKDEIEKYELVLTLLESKYGENTILVDSSKNSYSYLKYLNENHDLKVIYLNRDVRSWTYSRHLSNGKPMPYLFLRWVLENHKVRKRIKNMGIQVLDIGYEELALYPEFIFHRICDYAEIPFNESLLNPEQTHSHIISGNIARSDKQKRIQWIYDARWMLSRKVLFYSPLFLLISAKNKKRVYGNLYSESINDFHIFGTTRKKKLDKKYN